MFLSDTSIRRPVLTAVVTASILLVGWVGYTNLPVRELPEIDFPVVSVSTILPGASPEVVETEVTEVLEEEINTIEGLKTLTSVSGEQASLITAEFHLDRDIDVALQDVRDKVSRVRGELPSDVEEPVIEKLDPEAWPIIWIPVSNPALEDTEVTDFSDNVLKEELQTLPGVGSIMLGGEKRFAVRVRLDPRRLAAYGLSVVDVSSALRRENVEIPSGRIESREREFTVRTEGEFPSPESFNELIVAWRDGSPIRLGELGVAEAGVENERTLARFNSEPTVGLGVIKQSDANTVAVADGVLAELDRLREGLPPGYSLRVAVNNAEFIERSLEEVRETLLIAFGLVVLVVFAFLRSGRATLIPSLAIPVSVVGTFAALYLLGFSINTLTLLALTLAIGIVVDDAIVVLENIYRHMEEGADRRTAAREGTAEIAFAVLAISFTLVIVFLPIAFVTGVVGRLFREFGISVAVSVLISAFVALTLTPMLCSRFLRLGHGGNRLFRAMEAGLDRVTRGFRRTLEWTLGRRALVVVGALAAFAASLWLMAGLGQEFVPPEDRGSFLITISAPEGSTLEYTDRNLREVERRIRGIEGVERYFSAIGLGFGGPAKVSEGIVFVRLADERELDQFEIMAAVRRAVADLAGVNVFVVAPSALSGGGIEKPLRFVIQSRDLDQLAEAADTMAARARELPGLSDVDTDLDLNKPQLTVTIDRNRAAALGVSVQEVASALQVLFGGQDVTKYKRGNERYEVVVQLQDRFRATPRDLQEVYITGRDGRLVQLSNVIRVEEGVGPSQINHYNRRRSVILDANLDGIPLGEGLERVRELAREVLPAGFTTAVAGQSEEFEQSARSMMLSFLLAVIGIYLVLAGQFESFLHPFTIMLALPFALVGAVVALAVFGMTLNIYSLIGVIMLMGLVVKNSILLVDYTNTLRERGREMRAAVVEAVVVRLRPILMTSISIIFGVLPIALALGAGAESRRPLGVAVVGGMVVSTALTLYVVPVFYTLFDDGLRWLGGRLARLRGARRAEREEGAEPAGEETAAAREATT
ncbi:MAG TPA: efflux RND transporter permease subunit [Thermoanaerobaculia bacterium]|nr:efflux RND transporter permease subunit [Thermoanaerobaculia bacterium]